MKLLNVGAGSNRPQSEIWWNLDLLRPHLAIGTPERIQLDSEPRYVEHDLSSDAELPFEENSFDGVLASHLIEHFALQEGARLLGRIKRVLKPRGIILISVPDASVFRCNWPEDTVENAQRLYGEPIHLPDGEVTFLDYAGFFREHKMLFSADSLWCMMTRARFENIGRIPAIGLSSDTPYINHEALIPMHDILNRHGFSLVMCGMKP